MIFIILSLVTYICISFLNKRSKIVASIILIIGYGVVFASRSMSVADTDAYFDIFRGDYEGSYEAGYVLLNETLKKIGLSFRQLLMFIATFNMAIWSICASRIFKTRNLLIPLLVFMSFSGVYNYGIILRASISESLMLISLTSMLLYIEARGNGHRIVIKSFIKELLLFLSLLTIAFFFHQTSLVFIFILILFIFPLGQTLRYILVASSLFLFLFPQIASYFTGTLSSFLMYNEMRGGYYLVDDINFKIGLTNIYLAICSVFYIHSTKYIDNPVEKRKYTFVLDVFVTGVLITALFSYIRAGSRLGLLLLFFEFILPAILLSNLNRERYKTTFRIIVVFVIINMIKLLTNVPSLWNYL